jgi:hypothetical protein
MAAVLALCGRLPVIRDDARGEATALLQLGGLSFNDSVVEALRAAVARTPDVASTTGENVQEDVPAAPDAPDRGRAPSTQEAGVILREALRTGVDPSLLVALRRAENGRSGKEFGVVSVAADGLDAQARVAANTVRNTLARFERDGGTAVDRTTGRYTEDFLRFFSSRYAPVGAANDPTGLNRHHAANLIALYQKASRNDG